MAGGGWLIALLVTANAAKQNSTLLHRYKVASAAKVGVK